MLFKDHFNNQLRQRIQNCEECKLKNQPGPVLGYGGLEADVMFISDAPKVHEASSGIPFTGIARQRMVDAITNNGLKKGEYYFTYMVKHVLPEGTKPNQMDHKKCFDILLEEIELINPRIIVSMGFYITEMLIREYALTELEKKPMKEIIGNGYIIPKKEYYSTRYKKKKEPRPKRYLIPTWSPAITNEMQNDQFNADIQTVKAVRNLSKLLFD